MRFLSAAMVAASLAGCAPSPAMVQMQTAYQAGNLNACQAVLAEERARNDAINRALFSNQPVPVQPPVYFPQMQMGPRQRTTCRPDYLGGFVCRTIVTGKTRISSLHVRDNDRRVVVDVIQSQGNHPAVQFRNPRPRSTRRINRKERRHVPLPGGTDDGPNPCFR